MIVLGIDPGLSGALACYDTADRELYIVDMPVLALVRGGAQRHDLDGHALRQVLASLKAEHAFVEQAQAMPKQSAYATGIFFQTYGEIRGLLIGCGLPFTVVHPTRWKRALAVPAGKDAARARASQLFPGQRDNWWPLKKHDGRAEAACIALYGARELEAERIAA